MAVLYPNIQIQEKRVLTGLTEGMDLIYIYTFCSFTYIPSAHSFDNLNLTLVIVTSLLTLEFKYICKKTT